jgi:hypothetical protein
MQNTGGKTLQENIPYDEVTFKMKHPMAER